MKTSRYWYNGRAKTKRTRQVSRIARVRHLERIAKMPYVNYLVWCRRFGVTYDVPEGDHP